MLDNLKLRIGSTAVNTNPNNSTTMAARLNARGGADQWTRMRQDKLYSLKKALLYSYQRAIVQKYDVKKESKANRIINIITRMQDQIVLNENELRFLQLLEQEYSIQEERGTIEYIEQLQQIVNILVEQSDQFRCLINHDKLKVQYQDKIISIPFKECPINSTEQVETNFHNGTVFKWVHGNKEEWTPDSYWIVYMQYSEETAYFRGQIRKADEQIEIIVVDEEGNESSSIYRGWMTGPNETTVIWNTKRGISWNDLNYTKLLYITKDQDTLAFFKRFDRVVINGKPWEVQAYNENYTTSKRGDIDSGIIRVALKQTYTSTDDFIKETLTQIEQKNTSNNAVSGKTVVRPYDIVTYTVGESITGAAWKIDSSLARIKSISQDGLSVKVEILSRYANKDGFDIEYGDLSLHVTINSM